MNQKEIGIFSAVILFVVCISSFKSFPNQSNSQLKDSKMVPKTQEYSSSKSRIENAIQKQDLELQERVSLLSRELLKTKQAIAEVSCSYSDLLKKVKFMESNKTNVRFTKEERHPVLSNGAFCFSAPSKWLDKGLAKAMCRLFGKSSSVASFGDGGGAWKSYFEQSCPGLEKYDSFDGYYASENRTNGKVKFIDLTVPIYGFPIYDWIVSLEVAEHIPAEFESIYLSNIFRHAKSGIVISWAHPRQNRGFSHVNGREKSYVIDKMKDNGFAFDEQATQILRHAVRRVGWLKNNVLTFRRMENREINEKGA